MKNLNKNKLQGFTLIELLVVITIIGILASIVVVNLNSARGKGQDTAIKEQMSQIRAQSSLYYDDNYGYSKSGQSQSPLDGVNCTDNNNPDTFFADPDFQRSAQAIQRNSGEIPTCYMTASNDATSPSQSWAMTAKLKTSTNKWCVDSYGSAFEVSTEPTVVDGGYKCVAAN